jgi:hypothetical protein
VNLSGGNIDTIKKSAESLIDGSKQVGIEVIAGKSKCIFLSRHQNAVQNYDVNVVSRSFENVDR